MNKRFSPPEIKAVILALGCLFFITVATPCFSEEKATPQDVIELVNKAADLLAKDMDAGLAVVNDKTGELVLKDTYIFAYDCANGSTIVAHPINPKLIGKKMMGLKDVKGNFFFVQMCEAAKRDQHEWVEYWWPKPGEKKPSRKLSLLINVPGTSVQVGAGIYDEITTVEALNNMSKK